MKQIFRLHIFPLVPLFFLAGGCAPQSSRSDVLFPGYYGENGITSAIVEREVAVPVYVELEPLDYAEPKPQFEAPTFDDDFTLASHIYGPDHQVSWRDRHWQQYQRRNRHMAYSGHRIRDPFYDPFYNPFYDPFYDPFYAYGYRFDPWYDDYLFYPDRWAYHSRYQFSFGWGWPGYQPYGHHYAYTDRYNYNRRYSRGHYGTRYYGYRSHQGGRGVTLAKTTGPKRRRGSARRDGSTSGLASAINGDNSTAAASSSGNRPSVKKRSVLGSRRPSAKTKSSGTATRRSRDSTSSKSGSATKSRSTKSGKSKSDSGKSRSGSRRSKRKD